MSLKTCNDSFLYVLIPANEESPLEEREGDKSGGLSNDKLVRTAKEYFFQQSGGSARAEAIDKASPEEKKVIAKQIKSQILSQNPNAAASLEKMDDASLLDLVRSTQGSPSCEIMALTVPTKGNQHRAVSMYAADESRNLELNKRATALMRACGHAPPSWKDREPGVYGDVFAGRCHDDEQADKWERVDFTINDVKESADWCAVARASGGGGGSGAAVASLSGVMSQTMSPASSSSQSSSPITWSQTDDEVELKFTVASGTKAKYVKVQFGMTSLKVSVAGQTLIQGTTGGKVSVEESTYTLQDATNGRELCVVLGKKEAGVVWPHAVS